MHSLFKGVKTAQSSELTAGQGGSPKFTVPSLKDDKIHTILVEHLTDGHSSYHKSLHTVPRLSTH